MVQHNHDDTQLYELYVCLSYIIIIFRYASMIVQSTETVGF